MLWEKRGPGFHFSRAVVGSTFWNKEPHLAISELFRSNKIVSVLELLTHCVCGFAFCSLLLSLCLPFVLGAFPTFLLWSLLRNIPSGFSLYVVLSITFLRSLPTVKKHTNMAALRGEGRASTQTPMNWLNEWKIQNQQRTFFVFDVLKQNFKRPYKLALMSSLLLKSRWPLTQFAW